MIEVALGDKQPVSTKLNMSAASSKNFDADSEQQEDIEMVKQQSIFDLVSMCCVYLTLMLILQVQKFHRVTKVSLVGLLKVERSIETLHIGSKERILE